MSLSRGREAFAAGDVLAESCDLFFDLSFDLSLGMSSPVSSWIDDLTAAMPESLAQARGQIRERYGSALESWVVSVTFGAGGVKGCGVRAVEVAAFCEARG